MAESTSMGRRLPKSSRSENMMRAVLSPPRPSLFLDASKALNACMLMTMTEISARLAKESISFKRLELYTKAHSCLP